MARKPAIKGATAAGQPARPAWTAATGGHVARTVLIAAAAGLGLYLCYRLAVPFLMPLTWAVVLAVAFAPVHRRIERRIGRPNAAAATSVTLAALAVVAPLLFVVQQLVREAARGAAYIQELLAGSHWRTVLRDYPTLERGVTWIEQWLNPAELFGNLARWLTAESSSLIAGSLAQALGVVLIFYFLFYFLRDRRMLVRTAVRLSPLDGKEAHLVMRRFGATVHAIIFGTLAVAVVQGGLGGLIFWWLDLPTPVFWGIAMGLLAILPVFGASLVWAPAAVMLAFDGRFLDALILAAWGGLLIATIDNLLFPVLVGNRLRLHTVIAFVGAVGGLVVFGASGVVLGPAVISVTLALVEIVKRRFDGMFPRSRPSPPPA